MPGACTSSLDSKSASKSDIFSIRSSRLCRLRARFGNRIQRMRTHRKARVPHLCPSCVLDVAIDRTADHRPQTLLLQHIVALLGLLLAEMDPPRPSSTL